MRNIDTDIWKAMMLKQGPSDVLIRRAEQRTLVRKVINMTITKVIFDYFIRPIVRKEVKREINRYMAYKERIREFKKRRRWPAV